MSQRHVLVVMCHPVPTSFVRAAGERAVSALRASGHEVEVIDLDSLQFDPVLGRSEWATRHAGVPDELSLHVDALRRATDLVLVYPTWYGSMPAKLKGWFDRVWGRGVAWDLRQNARSPRGLLVNITHLWVVTTHGSTRLTNRVQGEGGLRFVRRAVRLSASPLLRTKWVAFYGNDRADDAARAAFLDRVERVFSSIH
jgi:NAD(P)H dehydrogenase (quinone)